MELTALSSALFLVSTAGQPLLVHVVLPRGFPAEPPLISLTPLVLHAGGGTGAGGAVPPPWSSRWSSVEAAENVEVTPCPLFLASFCRGAALAHRMIKARAFFCAGLDCAGRGAEKATGSQHPAASRRIGHTFLCRKYCIL